MTWGDRMPTRWGTQTSSNASPCSWGVGPPQPFHPGSLPSRTQLVLGAPYCHGCCILAREHLPAAALPGALDGPRVPASGRGDPTLVAGGSHLSSRKDLAAGVFM